MSPVDPKVVKQPKPTQDSATELSDAKPTQSAGGRAAATSPANRMTVIVAILGIIGTITAAIVSPLLGRSRQPVIVGAPLDKTVVVVHTVIVERTVVVTSVP